MSLVGGYWTQTSYFVCKYSYGRRKDVKLSLVLPEGREMQVREAQIPRKLNSGTIGAAVNMFAMTKRYICGITSK